MAGAPRIRIDLNSPVPATRQIADGLRVELVEGRLKPGTDLPSVRRIAMELGVHFNTVAEAYRVPRWWNAPPRPQLRGMKLRITGSVCGN